MEPCAARQAERPGTVDAPTPAAVLRSLGAWLPGGGSERAKMWRYSGPEAFSQNYVFIQDPLSFQDSESPHLHSFNFKSSFSSVFVAGFLV